MSQQEADERRIAAALKAVEGLPTRELEKGIVAETIDAFQSLMLVTTFVADLGLTFPPMVNADTGEEMGTLNPDAAVKAYRGLNGRLEKALVGHRPHDLPELRPARRRSRKK